MAISVGVLAAVLKLSDELRPAIRIAKRNSSIRVVKLNGVLRPNAFYADGRRGVVREYLVDAKGRKYLEGGRLATQELRGKVTWVRID